MSDSDPDAEPKQGGALGADLIIPAMAAAFTIYFLVDSANLVWEARANGTVIGVVLLVLIAVQVGRIVRSLRTAQGTLSLGQLAATDLTQFKRLSLIVILIVFIAAIPWLGTTLGIFLVMLAAMWTLGLRDVRHLLSVSFGTAAVVYLLFIAFLQTRLPTGPIEKLLAPLFGGA